MKRSLPYLFILILSTSLYSQGPGAAKTAGRVLDSDIFISGKQAISMASASEDDYVFSTTTYTFNDIVIFSYFNESFFYLLDQSGMKMDSVMLNQDEFWVFSPGSGVYRIDGNKSFTVLIGDPVSAIVQGFYAVDESGSPLSTKLNTYMPGIYDYSEQFVVFAYFDNTEVTVFNMTDSVIAGATVLNKGEHLELNNLGAKFASVSASKPVSALSYADQGYYIPSANGTFTGTLFFGFSGYVGWWSNGIVVTAYHDSTEYLIQNSQTKDTLQYGMLNYGEVFSLEIDAEVYWNVFANKPVTVSNTPYAGWSSNYQYLTRQVDETGRGVGTHFITPVVSGAYDIFSFGDDNQVIVTKFPDQDTVYNGTLQSGEHYNFSSQKAVYKVTSTENISVISSFLGAGADFVPLDFAVGLADLSISADDIEFLPESDNREVKDPLQLKATVHNYGYKTAYNVPFQFFNGHPSGGYPIGAVKYADPIQAGGTADFTVDWTVPENPEFQAVYAVTDNEDVVLESNSSNNTAFKFIIPNEDLLPPLSTVIQAPASVGVMNDTLEFDMFEITASLFNTGTVTASNSIAALQLPEYLSSENPDTVDLGSIEQQSSQKASWTVKIDSLPSEGTAFFYSVWVAADSVAGKWINRMLIIDDPSRVTALEKEENTIPQSMFLEPNYPNPFNPTTTIEYNISQTAHVLLEVYDITGRKVQTLADGLRQPGHYHAFFDGSRLSSGIFFIRLNVDGRNIQVRKMTLLK